jgi:hypothetical protein
MRCGAGARPFTATCIAGTGLLASQCKHVYFAYNKGGAAVGIPNVG